VKHVIHVLIILALAAAVYFIPGGGAAAATVSWLLWVAFLGTLAFAGVQLYRQFNMTLLGLEDRWRAVLYAAIGVIVLTLTGTKEMWNSGIGSIVWIALLAVSAYGLFLVVRSARSPY
jgi:hypothetical protein